MNDRERFLRTMRYEPVDHRPLHLVGAWDDTLRRWRREGLPEGVDAHALLGVQPLRVANVGPAAGIFPPFEERVISEDAEVTLSLDAYGRTVKNFKDHTSMPEWIDFPVKTGDDLRRMMDRHFDTSNLEARFPPDWERKTREGAARHDIVLIDGGCYYNTLRSLAGVENASYLLYDAPELVDELFERYFTVVMAGLRRAVKIVTLDVIGFGEDIAYKTGTLISPEMFRRMILPRYRQAMEFAQAHGIDLAWYDSDGDVRAFIPDYLAVGINGLAPCEVAAGMDPVELRRTFGKSLRMLGGFDKRLVARGKAAIDAEFRRLQPVIEEGGYLPAIDHSVSADISWDNYRHFIDALRKASGQIA
jgi:uroporphyrinogen decarboxylase